MIKDNEYKIQDNSIDFQFYNLFFSSLHKNGIVTLDRINAIDLNSSPHSLIIDHSEIIFLNHNDTNSLEPFALKNNIPHTSHIDTWAILTSKYLNFEQDDKTLDLEFKKLELFGIGKSEFNKISNGLWWTLSGVMEWGYIGLWDVLAMKQFRNPLYPLYGKNYYWKLMSIGLRGSEYEYRSTR